MYKLFLRNEREDARYYLSTKKLHTSRRDDNFTTEVLQKLKLRYLLGIVLHFSVNPAFSFHNFCSHFLLHSHTCSIMWSRTTYVSMFERFIDYLHTTHLGVEINFMPKEHHPSGTRGSSLSLQRPILLFRVWINQ